MTLVELLVTASLLGMVAMAVAATVAGGLRVWQRVQARGIGSEALQIAAEQLRRDLRSARRFTPIGFEGEHDRLSFPALVLDPAKQEPQLGRLGYFFDWGRKRLCRSQYAYPRSRRFSVTSHCSSVLQEVRRVRFSYYQWDEETASGDWTGSWDAEEPPLAVKVEIGYDGQRGSLRMSEAIVIHLPIATASLAEQGGP